MISEETYDETFWELEAYREMFEYEQGECPAESVDDSVDNNGDDSETVDNDAEENELVDNEGDNNELVDEEATDAGSQDNITENDNE